MDDFFNETLEFNDTTLGQAIGLTIAETIDAMDLDALENFGNGEEIFSISGNGLKVVVYVEKELQS